MWNHLIFKNWWLIQIFIKHSRPKTTTMKGKVFKYRQEDFREIWGWTKRFSFHWEVLKALPRRPYDFSTLHTSPLIFLPFIFFLHLTLPLNFIYCSFLSSFLLLSQSLSHKSFWKIFVYFDPRRWEIGMEIIPKDKDSLLS